MKLSLDNDTTTYVIHRYERGRIVVNDETISASVVVMPGQLLRDWRPESFAQLCTEDIQHIVDLGPEIIILGTGEQQRFPHPTVTEPSLRNHIGIEVMDTAAACRTFNVLSSEGRNVAAALMMI